MIEALDTCGCCRAEVPEPLVSNRPGLPAIEHRIGIHPEFMRRMLDLLPRLTGGLATRDRDDPSLALLDGFATMADVLTFYQERLANEGYLRTATERRSVLELARTIGYELNPGVSASTFLQFSVDNLAPPPGQARTPGRSTVPKGTKVQSMPGQDELPQTFETSREIVARHEWNGLRPRLKRPQPLTLGTRRLFLDGLATGLELGDRILIAAPGTDGSRVDTQVLEVAAVAEEPRMERTRIDLKEVGKKAAEDVPPPPFVPTVFPPPGFVVEEKPLTETVLHNEIIQRNWPDDLLRAFVGVHGWDLDFFRSAIDAYHRRAHHNFFDSLFRFDFSNWWDIFEPFVPDPPIVMAHSPAPAATGMSSRVNVTIRFSEEMLPATINSSTVTLRNSSDGRLVPAQVRYIPGARKAVLDPIGPLALNEVQYVARVAGGAGGARSALGIPLAADFTFSFKTAHVNPNPFITASTPKKEGFAPVDAPITITFSEPVIASTVTPDNVKLQIVLSPNSFEDVPALVTYDPATRTATIKPKARLAYSEHYRVFAEDRITDERGAKLEGDREREWSTEERPPVSVPVPKQPVAYAFRERAGFFGNNAPQWGGLAKGEFQKKDPWTKAWEDTDRQNEPDDHPRTIWTDSQKKDLDDRVYLERAVEGVRSDNWVVVEDADEITPYWITDVSEGSRSDYALSGPSTSFVVSEVDGFSPEIGGRPGFMVRSTTANVGAEALALAQLPIDDPLLAGHQELVLERMILELKKDQPLALRGELRDLPGVVGDEIVVLGEVFHQEGFTTLRFEKGLKQSYVRRTVTLSANVVAATHGETVAGEVLGGGDGAEANQRFRLRKPPLTHVSAPTPTGAESTLELRVDGLLWEQAPTLYALGPRDRRYLLRNDDDGGTTLILGDGRRGARPPSGLENLVATYRTGTGAKGMVGAERLTLMQTRPLGITSVTNPLPAGGAAEPETLDGARANAPLTLSTMDRVVSLRDFEDFARGFAGIGKAQSVELWQGSDQLVHLTVAGEGGASLPDDLITNLRAAIDRIRDPGVRLEVDSFARRYFELEAELIVDPAHLPATVIEAARAALGEAFSFERRAFGQAVTAAEAVAVLQAVPGVVALDLNVLRPVEAPSKRKGKHLKLALPQKVPPALFAGLARVEGALILPAELLLLTPAIPRLTTRR